jgi:hypothetical protein
MLLFIYLIVTAAFWTVSIINGFSDGWKLPLIMISLWFLGGFIFGFLSFIFLALEGILTAILMIKGRIGLSSAGGRW